MLFMWCYGPFTTAQRRQRRNGPDLWIHTGGGAAALLHAAAGATAVVLLGVSAATAVLLGVGSSMVLKQPYSMPAVQCACSTRWLHLIRSA